MELKKLSCDLTICKLQRDADIGLYSGFCFIARTDEELSLVCRTEDAPGDAVEPREAAVRVQLREDAPGDAVERSDGWRAFRIQGVLDFSLVGILSKISGILAENGIGIFAVSTFNTDYILVKAEAFARALAVLAEAGYTIE